MRVQVVHTREADIRTPLHDIIASSAVTSPLYGLCDRRHSRILMFFIPIIDGWLIHGANPHAVDKTGQCVLHSAQRALVLRNRTCMGYKVTACMVSYVAKHAVKHIILKAVHQFPNYFSSNQ